MGATLELFFTGENSRGDGDGTISVIGFGGDIVGAGAANDLERRGGNVLLRQGEGGQIAEYGRRLMTPATTSVERCRYGMPATVREWRNVEVARYWGTGVSAGDVNAALAGADL